MKLINVCGHSFLPELIEKGDLVYDCGANYGEFSSWCDRYLDNSIIAFEADPRLFTKLPKLPNVEFIGAAVAANEGHLAFALGTTRCSSAVFKETDDQVTVNVPAVMLDKFCSHRAPEIPIGLLKLDIEGSELEVLENLKPTFLKQIRQISVEFHDFLDPRLGPRVRAVTQRLKAEGFYLVRFSYYTWGDCLFVNRDLCTLNYIQRMKLHAYDKYWKGVLRHMKAKIVSIRTRYVSSQGIKTGS